MSDLGGEGGARQMRGPLALIAELTHRCPLRCVYCSNPLEMKARGAELPTSVWVNVFRQAAELGVLQLDLTGGEPLARPDLLEVVGAARAVRLYTNLITSGIGLTAERLDALIAAGLDHIQLSFQDSDENFADNIAGAKTHKHKVEIAGRIREANVGFTINVVVHRKNLDRLEEIIGFAEELRPDRLEIANVQYYGWALKNRAELLPTEAQLEASQLTVKAAQQRLQGRMRIEFVTPDYYARYPKPCMGGWGRKMMLINPSGEALPCHAAGVIPGMHFENVQDKSLREIWDESAAFRRFRGQEWMPEPCRSCDRRELDFGGCRCQAFLLTGDASATDPTCSLAPAHEIVTAAVAEVNSSGRSDIATAVGTREWIYRANPR
jgi:pyrroloquinoline quinone biosynthesis protein E